MGAFGGAGQGSENGQIAQQRYDADDDHDDPGNLFGLPVNRQHANKVKDQHDDKEGDEKADKYAHGDVPSVSMHA